MVAAHRADRRGLLRRTNAVELTSVRPQMRPEERAAAEISAGGGKHATRQPELRASSISTSSSRRSSPGARKKSRRAPAQGLVTLPILGGVAALALAVTGAMSGPEPVLTNAQRVAATTHHPLVANAMTGVSATSARSHSAQRAVVVSRGSGSTRGNGDNDNPLAAKAEKQAKAREAALDQLDEQAQAQAVKIAMNLWVFPMDVVQVTAEFGDYGLWSNYHTGIDFNGDTGDPIKAIAGGVVTAVGYDGAYGNKTVVTLEDGTEIWYAHQNAFATSLGDRVRAGQLIGYVGSTGNVTGSHLHLEVRPGGGDPVDPRAAFVANGLSF